MANHNITGDYTEQLRMLTIQDPVHCDVVNPLFAILINNDAYLKKYVDNKIDGLIDGSSEALDTLKELATALGDDPNFSKTILDLIAEKFNNLAGAGRTTETIKGVSDSVNTLKNDVDKFKGQFKELKVVDTKPSALEEGVLYLVKEEGGV